MFGNEISIYIEIDRERERCKRREFRFLLCIVT